MRSPSPVILNGIHYSVMDQTTVAALEFTAFPKIPRYHRDIVITEKIDGSLAQPGFMKPEGIVIFHTAANQLFKKTLENDESPKGKQ